MATKRLRLILKDSNNRAVYVDFKDFKKLGEVLKTLKGNYEELLAEETATKEATEKHDKKSAKEHGSKQKKKQDSLMAYKCPECGVAQRGGNSLCPNKDCSRFNDAKQPMNPVLKKDA